MNELFAWLLDLDRLSLGAEGVRLGFERPLPLWLWPGVAAACLAVAIWSYTRMTGPAAARMTLGALRGVVLALLVTLIAGPQLVQREETVEQDWVLVLVDRSASMTIEDAPAPDAGGETTRQPRERQLRRALERTWPMWRELSESRRVVWLGFNAGAFDLETGEGSASDDLAIDLGEPTGRRTNLGLALEQALRRVAARPLAGVVVLSDGRSLDEPDRAAIRRLQTERAPVFTVALGSEQPVGDLGIARVDGPGMAFVKDVAPVTVRLDRLGAAADLGGVVRLVDQSTGIVLDEKRIEPDERDDVVMLTHKADDAGEATWVVEVVPDGPDLISGNNRAEVALELVDRPLRALYVDGYPRWEQRYLKNLLIREGSVVSSNLLLAPARRYLQEGDVELDRLPTSLEEWAEFDVVILGDVRPEVFNKDQLANLKEHVALRGGGLIWIGGPGATPDAWRETPLADLIPFSGRGSETPRFATPVLMEPTPLAESLGVLRLGAEGFGWPQALSDPGAGWSQLRWAQRIDPRTLKPTTETLAMAVPAAGGTAFAQEEGGFPLVMSMRYGAGRSLYVATDEIWRWRFGRGERLPEQFWVQLIRLLGRQSLARAGQAATLAAAPNRALVDQPVRIVVELLDQSLVDRDLGAVQVEARRLPDPGEAEELTPTVELTLSRDPGDPRVYSTTWAPTEPGEWIISPLTSALLGLDLQSEVSVSLPNDELRRPETDHLLLTQIALRTEGRSIAPEEMDVIASELPNRQVRRIRERTEALWDTPLALILLIGLLTAEWVGRRIIRLI